MTCFRLALAIVAVTVPLTTAEAQCSSRGGGCPTGNPFGGGIVPAFRPPTGVPFNNGGPVGGRVVVNPPPQTNCQDTRASSSVSVPPPETLPATRPDSGSSVDAAATNTTRTGGSDKNSLPGGDSSTSATAEKLGTELEKLLGAAVVDDQTFEVVIQNPRTGLFVTYKTFPSRAAAQRALDNITRQFWLVSESYDGTRQYQVGGVSAVAGHLAKDGTKVEKIVAEVREVNDQSLADVLAQTPGTANVDKSPSSNKADEEPKAPPTPETSDLGALVGVWESVAISESGEPLKLVLKLDAGGTTTLTLPDGSGGVRTIETRTRLVDDELLLPNGNSLGRVENIEADRVVLNGPDGRVTFTRRESLN
jgi:hypothetical protein